MSSRSSRAANRSCISRRRRRARHRGLHRSRSSRRSRSRPTSATAPPPSAQAASYRQRDESGRGPLYTPVIDTYYQESADGGSTWTTPLKVDRVASNPWYGAFSRNGTFEGDYDQIASAGGYTYIVRCQGAPAYTG